MSGPPPPPRRTVAAASTASGDANDAESAADTTAKPTIPPRRGEAAGGAGGAGAGGAGAGVASSAAGDEDDDGDTYKAPPKTATLEEIMNREEEDESLAKYKATLLAGAKDAKTDDPRHVVVEKFEVLVDGRPPIVLKLSTPEEQAAAEKTKLVFKEGQVYRTQVTFRVQHDVVLGLQFTNSVFKMKMRVDRTKTMIGSYGPQADPYVWKSPKQTWPKGFMVRGSYSAKILITDDDGTEHLSVGYKFDIKAKWPKE